MSELRTRSVGETMPTTDKRPHSKPADDFTAAFGEPLTAALNLDSWRQGADLVQEYARIEEEVAYAARQESEHQTQIRELVFPKLKFDSAPDAAGKYETTLDELKTVQQEILFSGKVEACDGTNQTHDTMAMTIHQIGVCLVSYTGNQGSWSQRLFRRDLLDSHVDPVENILSLLRRRELRGGIDHPAAGDELSELAQRAIMSYAEAAVLLRKSSAPWRMGHGSPAPYQSLAGGGNADFLIESIRVLRELIDGHRRFVYVTSEPTARAYLTIGQALRPLEYVVIGTLQERIEKFTEQVGITGRVTVDNCWDGEPLSPAKWLTRFRDTIASKVLFGVYRASLIAPPQMFYAHEDHIHEAARIALADSMLLPTRGFPVLIDLADQACRSIYGGGSLDQIADMAYAKAGVPFRYGSERHTRS